MTSRTGFPRWWGAVCGLWPQARPWASGSSSPGSPFPPLRRSSPSGKRRSPHAAGREGLGDLDLRHRRQDGAVRRRTRRGVPVLHGGGRARDAAALHRVRWTGDFRGYWPRGGADRHAATGSYAVPTIFGALAGAVALWWLVLTARQAAAAGRPGRAARAPVGGDGLPPVAFGPGDHGAAGTADAAGDAPAAGTGTAGGPAGDAGTDGADDDEHVGSLPAGGRKPDRPPGPGRAETGRAGLGRTAPGRRSRGRPGPGLPGRRRGGTSSSPPGPASRPPGSAMSAGGPWRRARTCPWPRRRSGSPRRPSRCRRCQPG